MEYYMNNHIWYVHYVGIFPHVWHAMGVGFHKASGLTTKSLL